MAYLQRLPVDILKIDRSLIAGLDLKGPHHESHAIVASVIGLAHTPGLLVVAEGGGDGRSVFVVARAGL